MFAPSGDVGLTLGPSGSPGLELNGMTMAGTDVAEVPPPLPLKGSTADYGNLMENQDLLGSPTPPPPPPHHRVSREPKWAFPVALSPQSPNPSFPMGACLLGASLGLIWGKTVKAQ